MNSDPLLLKDLQVNHAHGDMSRQDHCLNSSKIYKQFKMIQIRGISKNENIQIEIQVIFIIILHSIYTFIPQKRIGFSNFYFIGWTGSCDFIRTVVSVNFSFFSKQYRCGTDKLQCERPYSFLHRLALTSNLSAFIVSNQSCVL